jgi:hypothetical protein
MCSEQNNEHGKMVRSRSVLWIIVICLSISLILPAAGLLGFVGFNRLYIQREESHDIKFDLELWNSGSKARIYSATATRIDAPRIKMSRDFIVNQPWRGKTKQELEAWLGKPDDFPFSQGWGFNYWVGLQRGWMKLDSWWLCFWFDDTGHAVEAVLKQD